MDGKQFSRSFYNLKNLRAIGFCCCCLTLTTLSTASQAGVVVVVNAKLPEAAATAEQIANIFLGKSNKLPGGSKVVPIDQEEGEASRDEFYSKAVKKDASQLNAYWSRLIFTGKGQPPKAVLDDDEVLEMVGSTPDAIGYMSGDAVDETVKVILEVK